MLITARFVVLNLPKSGSSFVRAVLKSIHARRRGGPSRWRRRDGLRELMLPNIRLPGRARDQHGTVAQIPRRHRDRPIMSVVRDPHMKIVSEYRFRWWAIHPPLPPAALRTLFPAFPDLSFAEFLTLSDHIAAAKVGVDVADRLGNLTIEFVQFFFPDPAAALARMSDDYVASGAWRRDMAPVELLRQEDLNRALAGFLRRNGYGEDEVALCLAHRPVNVTAGDNDAQLWTAETLDRFRRRERHLFAMLDVLGFRYASPLPTPLTGLLTGQGDIAAHGS